MIYIPYSLDCLAGPGLIRENMCRLAMSAATPTLPESKAPADLESDPLVFNTSAAAPEPEGMQQDGVLTEGGAAAGLAGIAAKIKENANHLLETKKPMSEFLDRSAMSKPATVSEGMTRLQKNMAYYRTNYFIFFLGTMALTFLMHPGALIWTSLLLVMWIYLFLVHTGPLVIGGREYNDREKVMGASAVSFFVVFFLTSVATTALYGASLSMGLIAVHAAFREPDDLFIDDAAGNSNLFASNMFQGIPGMIQPPASGANIV